jgi:hypothetical protein
LLQFQSNHENVTSPKVIQKQKEREIVSLMMLRPQDMEYPAENGL